ncbi:MAG: ATP-binding protein, partial [Rickettsiales bacterium]
SLAHNGVLFLDEFPEFPRTVLDSLRQPIEKGSILISRSSSHVTYPARFQLIAAMNPCRCGYLSDKELGCGRAPRCAIDYQMKISGPLLDRIDIHVDVQAINISEIDDITTGEDTQTIKNRVENARMIQKERYKSINIKTNSELDGKLLTELTLTDHDVKSIINDAAEKMKLTMRAYNRILKVARTIADMNNSENVQKEHVKEAIIYRPTYLKK